MAGVALGDIYLRFTWRLAGSGGALGLGLVACDAAALCVAGVALGDISTFHVAGVAFGDIHLGTLETSTFLLPGRRGTQTGLAQVARLGWDWSPVTPRHFAWQAWPLETSTFPEHRLLILFN